MGTQSTDKQVVVDGRAALRPEVGGVERWARQMTVRLRTINPERYSIAKPPKSLAHRSGHLWEQTLLPLTVLRKRAALLYSPANSFPITIGRRSVVHIPDVAPLRNPDWYSKAYVAWQRVFYKRVAAHARHIVTGSGFAKEEIVELLGISEERITVVPGGVSSRFSSEAGGSEAKQVFGLDRPYVLTVGSVFARKNLELLSECVQMLSSKGIDLVVAGGSRSHLQSSSEATGAKNLGYVSDELLPSLYAGAEVFVFPSKYEGFGLPCLEAMASGVPVVAASDSALPEVCGSAGTYFSPYNPTETTEMVKWLIEDELLREEKIKLGLERVKQFSWQRSAEQIDALLSDLLNER